MGEVHSHKYRGQLHPAREDSFFLFSLPPFSPFTHLNTPPPLSTITTMALPDFMTNPNAVLGDTEHEWRYGRVPDYNKVNAAFERGTFPLLH